MHVPQLDPNLVRQRTGGRATSFIFGVSGILRNSALVMYDRSSFSLWTQEGRAIAGSLKGLRLRQLPSLRTTWAVWRDRYPQTLVMTKPKRPKIQKD